MEILPVLHEALCKDLKWLIWEGNKDSAKVKAAALMEVTGLVCSAKKCSDSLVTTLALAVSKMVSTRRMSAPPSNKPLTCSEYASTSASKAAEHKHILFHCTAHCVFVRPYSTRKLRLVCKTGILRTLKPTGLMFLWLYHYVTIETIFYYMIYSFIFILWHFNIKSFIIMSYTDAQKQA